MNPSVVAVQPGDLPEDLKASIVNTFDFDSVPTLDLSCQDKSQLLAQVRRAARDVGFCTVINHGVPKNLIDSMFSHSKAFFERSQAEKERFLLDPEGAMVGYFGKGMENLDDVLDGDNANTSQPTQPAKKVDNKEGFDMNGNVGGAMHASNVNAENSTRWTKDVQQMPDDLVENFGDTMRNYQQQVLELGWQLLELIGEALELKTEQDGDLALRKSCDHAVCHHRILHYPPLTDLKKEVSIGAHVDYGFLTLLAQDMTGGLHVLNNVRGEWVHVPPVKHSFVLNFGSMLAAWTNNEVKATVHRVINLSANERFSSPFFLRPSLDTLLDPAVFERLRKDGEEGGDSKAVTCEQMLTNFYRKTGQAKTG